jgi:micrococcal nuclease
MKEHNTENFLSAIAVVLMLFILIIIFGFTTIKNYPYAHDGDTIYIYDSVVCDVVKCRLNNVDCPELKQDFGKNSRDSVQNIIHHDRLKIVTSGIDKYNRHLCDIYVNGLPLDSVIIANGWGYVYYKYLKKKSLIFAESKAKSQKKGVWKLQPMQRPWDYRSQHR